MAKLKPRYTAAEKAVLVLCNILRKSVELTFRRGAMHGEDVEEGR
jgi:hypothetical protein